MNGVDVRYEYDNIPKEKLDNYLMYQRVIWCIIIVLTIVACYFVCDMLIEESHTLGNNAEFTNLVE